MFSAGRPLDWTYLMLTIATKYLKASKKSVAAHKRFQEVV
jgi:hypothetical protein